MEKLTFIPHEKIEYYRSSIKWYENIEDTGSTIEIYLKDGNKYESYETITTDSKGIYGEFIKI